MTTQEYSPKAYDASTTWAGWDTSLSTADLSKYKTIGLSYMGFLGDLFYDYPVGVLGKQSLWPATNSIAGASYPSDFRSHDLTATGFAQKLLNAYNANKAGTLPSIDVTLDPAQITTAIANYATDKIHNQGVFSQLIPGSDNGYLFAYEFLNLHFDKGTWINDKKSDLDHSWLDQNLYNDLKSYYYPLVNEASAKSLSIRDASFFVGGAISNANIDMSGEGDKIFIVSPTMNAVTGAVSYRTNKVFNPNYDYFVASSFYPTAQGVYQSNTLKTGSGNDLIYYDSSFSDIDGSSGNDIFAPSYGSFNFASNYMFKYLNDLTSGNYPMPGTGQPTEFMFAPISGTPNFDETWYDPAKTSVWDKIVSAVSSAHTSGSDYDNADFEEVASASYIGFYPDEPNNKNNHIGGEKIVGGAGDDTFYGADPAYYTNNNPGGTNATYLVASGDSHNARFYYQNYATIEMYGGVGNDVFYLGDPSKIDTDDHMYSGDYSYQISVNHDKKLSNSQKEFLDFAKYDSSYVDVVNFKLNGSSASYTNSSSSYNLDNEPAATPLEKAKAGIDLVNTLFNMRDNQGELKVNQVWDGLPYVGTMLTVASVACQLYPKLDKFFTPDAPPIRTNSVDTIQKLGAWKKAVAINDWNPNTVINIEVNPTVTFEGTESALNSVGFHLSPSQRSGGEPSTAVFWDKGADSAALLELTGFNTTNSIGRYGYYSFDFFTGETTLVNSSHLSFFGSITNGDSSIKPLENYTSGINLFPFYKTSAGGKLFYWGDVNNSLTPGFDLMKARASASEVTLQFDSRSLGWSWDFKYTDESVLAASQASTPEQAMKLLVIDSNSSGLWFRDKNKQDLPWEFYSFNDIDKNLDASIKGLLARTYYKTHDDNGDHIFSDQVMVNTKIESYKLLNSFITSIDDFHYAPNEVHLSKISDIKLFTKTDATHYALYSTDKDATYRSEVTFSDGKANLANQVKLTLGEVVANEKKYAIDLNNSGTIGSSAALVLAYASPNDQVSYVKSLYQELLDRDPDSVGLAYWSDPSHSLSRVDILRNFVNSDEYALQYHDKFEFVNLLYQDVLGRAPDKEGQIYWENCIDSGMNYAEVVGCFIDSAEFKALPGVG